MDNVLVDYLIFKIEDIRLVIGTIGLLSGAGIAALVGSTNDCLGHSRRIVSKKEHLIRALLGIICVLFITFALVAPNSKELSYLLTGNQTYYEVLRKK